MYTKYFIANICWFLVVMHRCCERKKLSVKSIDSARPIQTEWISAVITCIGLATKDWALPRLLWASVGSALLNLSWASTLTEVPRERWFFCRIIHLNKTFFVLFLLLSVSYFYHSLSICWTFHNFNSKKE